MESTPRHSHPHHHEYKYTLIVTGARILDVTTIRDLHTGLPRGTFGFVVRGQRHLSVSSTTVSLTVSSPPTTIPSTMTVSNKTNVTSSSSQDGTTGSMTDSFVLAEDEEELGRQGGGIPVPGTQDSSSAAAIVPIRDYLCAVSTLEEAQMWVVALQWAASMQQPPPDDQVRSSTNKSSLPVVGNVIMSTTTTSVPNILHSVIGDTQHQSVRV